MNYKFNSLHYFFSCSIILLSLMSAVTVVAEEVDIEPEADKILKQMSLYLAGLKQFEITTESTIEKVMDSGQKIMFEHDNKVVVKRPNRLYAMRVGDVVDQKLYYNGKSLTFYAKQLGFYSSVDAPDSLSGMLDYALQKFNLTTPGVDLLHADSYERLSNELISAFYVSKSTINGIECHHLAFRNSEVDWQIWIQTGDKPLPIKYVITSRWIASSPSFSVTMDWKTKSNLSESTFNFTPPKGVEKIDMLPSKP